MRAARCLALNTLKTRLGGTIPVSAVPERNTSVAVAARPYTKLRLAPRKTTQTKHSSCRDPGKQAAWTLSHAPVLDDSAVVGLPVLRQVNFFCVRRHPGTIAGRPRTGRQTLAAFRLPILSNGRMVGLSDRWPKARITT